jgi:hypothetical protein
MQTFNFEEKLFQLSDKAYKAFPVDETESVSIVLNPIQVKNKRIVQVWIDICDESGLQLKKYEADIKRSFLEFPTFQLALDQLDLYLEFVLDKNTPKSSSKVLEEGEVCYENTGFGD